MRPVDEQALLEFQRFYKFINEIILPYEPGSYVKFSPFHHKLMYAACKPRSATAAPRGSLKSYIISKYRALHRMVDPNPDWPLSGNVEVLEISAAGKLVRDHMAWIQWHLQHNKALLNKYGKLADPSTLTWNENQIKLTNNAKMNVFGYTADIRGQHPTDIFVDDMESENNVATDDTLETLKDKFWRVIFPMRMPETRITVIGTIIRLDSLLADLIVNPEWHGKKWRALEEGEPLADGSQQYTSIWPQRWSVGYLLSTRRSMGVHRFNAEYQNEPVASGDPVIYQEWIRRHDAMQLSHIMPIRRYIACDPAFTEERWGDFSAITVMDEATDGRLFERLCWRKRCTMPDLIRTLLGFYQQFSKDCPCEMGVEEVQAQKGIRQHINEMAPMINVIPLKTERKDKTRRLIDVSRYFEMGLVSIMSQFLNDALISFPDGNLDVVDATVYTLKMYEKNHPIILDGSSKEIDISKQMDDNALQIYMERALMGYPGYQVTQKLLQSHADAYAISDGLDDL